VAYIFIFSQQKQSQKNPNMMSRAEQKVKVKQLRLLKTETLKLLIKQGVQIITERLVLEVKCPKECFDGIILFYLFVYIFCQKM